MTPPETRDCNGDAPASFAAPAGSAEISWVIENITKESSLLELAEAVKQGGSKLFEINGDYTAQTIEELRRYATGKTAIFDGSINMAELVTRDMPTIHVIGTPENYLCSRYYPKLHGLLFNDRYELLPMSEVERAATLAVDGCVFVRPDGGQKQFQAGLVEVGELANLKHHGEMKVLASPPKNVTGEWRCACDAYGIVAVSSYRINGKPIREPSAPIGVMKMCEKAAARYQPDPLWIMDICADNDGKFWLMELNQFTGAGLYACDKAAIVRAVERVASAFPPNDRTELWLPDNAATTTPKI
jgi:hypothetical protein